MNYGLMGLLSLESFKREYSNMKRAFLFCALALLLVFAGSASAQTETGQIAGTITDATGAVVTSATVIVKSLNTGLTRETTTNSSGLYTISGLKPDLYEVTVQASGFQKYARRQEVAVGSYNEVSAQLTLGSAAETVEVSGSGQDVTVNTETQTLSEGITARQIDLLPTSPTRNPYALVGISGNVSEDQQFARLRLRD